MNSFSLFSFRIHFVDFTFASPSAITVLISFVAFTFASPSAITFRFILNKNLNHI